MCYQPSQGCFAHATNHNCSNLWHIVLHIIEEKSLLWVGWGGEGEGDRDLRKQKIKISFVVFFSCLRSRNLWLSQNEKNKRCVCVCVLFNFGFKFFCPDLFLIGRPLLNLFHLRGRDMLGSYTPVSVPFVPVCGSILPSELIV